MVMLIHVWRYQQHKKSWLSLYLYKRTPLLTDRVLHWCVNEYFWRRNYAIIGLDMSLLFLLLFSFFFFFFLFFNLKQSWLPVFWKKDQKHTKVFKNNNNNNNNTLFNQTKQDRLYIFEGILFFKATNTDKQIAYLLPVGSWRRECVTQEEVCSTFPPARTQMATDQWFACHCL